MITQFYEGLPRRPWLKKYQGFIVGLPAIFACWWFDESLWWGALAMVIAGHWWFGNDEPSAQGNTFWYKYCRNPLQNFRWYVIGFVDKAHFAIGRDSGDPDRPLVNKRSDIRPVAESGFTWSFVCLGGIPLFPWISCAYRHFTAYIGWEPYGGFGILMNFSNSDLK